VPQYKALLIGNWEYDRDDPRLQPLRGPRHNLIKLKEALCDPSFGLLAGAEDRVQVKTNLNAPEISTALRRFVTESLPDDHLIIYYTGHGTYLRDTSELGLCGVDARHDTVEDLSFRTSLLQTWMGARIARASSQILVLDCCYAGAFVGGQMGGADIAEEDLAQSLGTGIGVLSAGAREPVPDAPEDEPTPFTKALVEIMLDTSLDRPDFLSLEDTYRALQEYQPRLVPQPVHNPGPRGRLPLARRAAREAAAQELEDWIELAFDTVEVEFESDKMHVTVSPETFVDTDPPDPVRQTALRRLPQLVDAVVRTREAGDESWDRMVRKAWECVGTTLFASLPDEVRELIRQADQRYREEGRILRLRVGSQDDSDARYHELLPWEYLLPPESNPRAPLRPLGLRDSVVIERTCAGSPGTTARPTDTRSAATVAARPQATPARASAASQADNPRRAGTSAAGQLAYVAVVNALATEFQGLGSRISDEVRAMGGTSLILNLGHATTASSPADWASFYRGIAQNPHNIVLLLPVKREEGVVYLGFDSYRPEPEWRGLDEVVEQLKRISNRRTVCLATVASKAGRDSYRGVAAAAQTMAAELRCSVVFVCHRPAFATHEYPVDRPEPRTFFGLMTHALAFGKPIDESFCYARTRNAVNLDPSLLPSFGVPGYYRVPSPRARLSTSAPSSAGAGS
jgi:Caspase domain